MGKRREWVVGDGSYNPLRRVVMTERVYTGFEVVYGAPPACCVCGRRIEPGMLWRWYVPAELRSVDEPVIGCVEGHEGSVIRVGGTWWRIMPEGERPERVGREEADGRGRAAAV